MINLSGWIYIVAIAIEIKNNKYTKITKAIKIKSNYNFLKSGIRKNKNKNKKIIFVLIALTNRNFFT